MHLPKILPPPRPGKLISTLLICCIAMVSRLSALPPDPSGAEKGSCGDVVSISISQTNFDICDFEYQVTIEVLHYYTSAHTFEIQFDYPVSYVAYDDDNAMQIIDDVSLGSGVNRVRGTVTSPAAPDENTPVFSSYTFTFIRYDSWAGLQKSFKARLLDSSCDPVIQGEENYNLSTTNFRDLRGYPATQLSTLLSSGVIVLQAGGSLPDLLIDDELVIDVPALIQGSSNAYRNIVLMPGASIQIATDPASDAGTPYLNANYAEFSTCPDFSLAEGIEVDPRASGSQVTQLNMQHCRVKDARFGINARPGSVVRIENTEFTNNYIGLNLDMTGASSGQEKVTFLGFSGNTFSTGSGQALKTAYSSMPEAVEERGYCGIRLINYRDFNVFGSNTFERLANGIVASNSILNVGNLDFTDMKHSGAVSAYPLEGFGIYLAARNNSSWANIGLPWAPMTFDDCKTGVFANRYAGKVEHCTMTDVDLGVDWQKSQTRDVTIRNNDIEAQQYGIRSFLNEPTHPVSAIKTNTISITTEDNGSTPKAAIRLDETQTGAGFDGGWTVNANDLTLEKGGNGIRYTNGKAGQIENNTVVNNTAGSHYEGIHIENVATGSLTGNVVTQVLGDDNFGSSYGIYSLAGWANAFTCNCLDNTDIGMQFYDMAEFTNAVRGNSFTDHSVGLQLGDDAQADTYIGPQIDQGNIWDLSAIGDGDFGGVNWNSLGLNLSKFIVDEAENADFNPPVDPGGGWFTNLSGAKPSFSCSSACSFPDTLPPHEGEVDSPTDLDEAIVDDMLPDGIFPATTHWKGEYRLYRKLLRRPGILTITKYTTFKNSRSTQPVGKLAYIAEERAKLFDLTSTQRTNLGSYRDTLLKKIRDIRQVDSLRQAGGSVNETQYTTLVSQRNTAVGQLEQFYFTRDTARHNKIQALLALNTAVVDTVLPATNQKKINDIILRLLDADTLATGNLDDLIAIAEQCPLEGGDAVYEARAFVRHLTGAEYDDLDLCSTASRSAQKPDKQSTSLGQDFYPNPTTGRIAWDNATGGQVTIEVYDLLGRLRLSRNTADSFIDLRPLPDGAYWIRLYPQVGTPLTQQVILVQD